MTMLLIAHWSRKNRQTTDYYNQLTGEAKKTNPHRYNAAKLESKYMQLEEK